MPTFLSAQNFGGGKAASGGSGGDSTPHVTRQMVWWEESIALSANQNDGRQWSLGNGALSSAVYLPHEWTIESVSLVVGLQSSLTAGAFSVGADVVVSLEFVDPASTAMYGSEDVDSDLEITLLASPDTAYTFMHLFTVEPASDIVLPAGSFVRPYTKSGVSGTLGQVQHVYQLHLKRNES